MSTYKIPDSITKKVQAISTSNSTKSKIDEINGKLDSVASKYTGSNQSAVPDKVELERMEFTKPSDDVIRQNSEALLSDYKNSNINNINQEYKLKEDELYSNKQDLIDNNQSNKQKLDQYYSQAKSNAEDQALKRGLARSSIIVNQLDAFDNEKINDYKTLDDELSSQINAINFEINGLSTQKQTALNNFDIAYAVKLQEKINELQEELDKKESEVIKYNNEIALKESEFNKKVDELKNELDSERWSDTTDIIDIYGKYGQNVVTKVKNDELYNTAKQYLSSLSESEIRAILNDEEFKNKMGTVYTKLVEDFS